MRWWKKQLPSSGDGDIPGKCSIDGHDDYSTGNPESFICARCLRIHLVPDPPKTKVGIQLVQMLTNEQAQQLVRSIRFL